MRHLFLLLPLLALGLFVVLPVQLALLPYVPITIASLLAYWKAFQCCHVEDHTSRMKGTCHVF
jgi:hypothetical protein